MFLGVGDQDAKLVAEHIKLHLHVGAVFLGEKSSQLGLYLGLLVKEVLDGGL